MMENNQEPPSLLILKQKSSSLKLAEQFLGNRGWQLFIVNNLKGLIVTLAQKQPQYMLLPIDFNHKKTAILPKILAQAFPVRIISYAELSVSASISKLQQAHAEYRLFPPVSGPAIERMIFKIQKDDEQKAVERQKIKNSGGHDFTLSESESGGFAFRLDGESQAAARGALSALLSDDSSDGAAGQASGYIADSGGSSGSTSSGSTSSGSTSSGSTSLGGGNINGGLGSSQPHLTASHIEGASSTEVALGAEFGEVPFYGRDDLQFPSTSKAQDKNKLNPNETTSYEVEKNDKNKRAASKSGYQLKSNETLSYREDPTPEWEFDPITGKQKAQPVYKFRSKELPEPETIMVKGTQKALDESAYIKEGLSRYQEVQKTSNAACIVVDSPKFSGYLVAAMGANRKIDEAFMKLIKDRLFGFLKANGEMISEGEKSMDIKIEQIDFEEWAVEQAEFLKKAIHEDSEVAMAFFPSKETSIKLEESVSEKMLKMDINELKEDVAVEFDLYIYLEENKKYLLYTPEGKPLYGSQRERLIEKGVKHMHLRKESSQNVKKYRAQNFLNDKISEFKLKKAQTQNQ